MQKLDLSTDDLNRGLGERDANAVRFVREIMKVDKQYGERLEAALDAFGQAAGWT
jgi:hypothetical protein